MSDGVNTVKAGDILEVTIDRPKANAIDLAASRRLNDIFTNFRDDAALKIAIITGAGDRFFSPGWDLKAAAAGLKSDEDWGVGGFGGLNSTCLLKEVEYGSNPLPQASFPRRLQNLLYGGCGSAE